MSATSQADVLVSIASIHGSGFDTGLRPVGSGRDGTDLGHFGDVMAQQIFDAHFQRQG